MKKLEGIFFVFSVVLLCSGADFTLWKDSKPGYVIALPENPASEAIFAGRELKLHLDKSSGCEFQMLKYKQAKKSGLPMIFIGQTEDVRKYFGKELPKLENQTSVIELSGNNILLTGGGIGMNYAVYDFLENEIGCRWFTPRPNGTQIPQYAAKIFSGKTSRKIPAYKGFRIIYTASNYANLPAAMWLYRNKENFTRFINQQKIPGMNTVFNYRDTGHGLFLYMPPDKKYKNYYRWETPKTYFEEHPEYYTLNTNGKRIPDGQLCFSSPGLRQEFFRRLEEHIKLYGTVGYYMIGANDWPGSFCYCDECKALEKKYDCVGGPLYDFILEICPKLAKKYPDVRIISLAYRKSQSEAPPKNIQQMPDNWVCDFAPIDDSCTQPLDGSQNRGTLENLKNWKKIAKNISFWYYICLYQAYGISERMQRDLQLALENGVKNMGLCGDGSLDVYGLQEYLFLKLMQDPYCDVRKLTDEYTNFKYGAAAPQMREYLDELEMLWRKSKTFVPMDGTTPASITYATVDLLKKWEDSYEKMLELTKDSPVHHENVRQAKTILDTFLVFKIATDPRQVADYGEERFAKLVADTKNRLGKMEDLWGKIATKRYFMDIENSELYAKLKNPALPEELRKFPAEKVHRLLLRGNVDDPDAATGCASSQILNKTVDFVMEKGKEIPYGYYDRLGKRLGMRGKIHYRDIVPNQYKLYYLGETSFSPDSLLWIATWHGAARTGNFCRVGDEHRKYDIYVSLKFTGEAFPGGKGENRIWRDQFFFVEK